MQQNNIDFDEIRVTLSVETTAEQLAEYGSGLKVPVLKDGDFLVWDSLSILEYVSDSNGWPSNQAARATARSVSCEMHSSFTNIRNALPMNCRKTFQNISLSAQTQGEIERVKLLWRQCRTGFGQDGEWLFGDYSIADAMYAPIALRFHGYGIALEGIEKAYVQSVLGQPCIKNWIEAGVLEREIIAEDEIDIS
jgi:glutathione S-transferase